MSFLAVFKLLGSIQDERFTAVKNRRFFARLTGEEEQGCEGTRQIFRTIG